MNDVVDNHDRRRRPMGRILVAASLVLGLLLIAWTVRRSRAKRAPARPRTAIEYKYERYVKQEGPARRGPEFEQLALWLSWERREGARQFRDNEYFRWLGPPDLTATMPPGKVYVFRYKRPDQPESALFVHVDRDRRVVLEEWGEMPAPHPAWKSFATGAPED